MSNSHPDNYVLQDGKPICSQCKYPIYLWVTGGWTHQPDGTTIYPIGACKTTPTPLLREVAKPNCKHCGKPLYASIINRTGYTHETREDALACGHSPQPNLTLPNQPTTTQGRGFSEEQRDKMAFIVHYRVLIEDNKKNIEEATKELEKAKIAYEKVQEAQSAIIATSSGRIKSHEAELLRAEDAFRASILKEVTIDDVTVQKESEPVVEAPIVLEPEEIGRIE